jgi:hypothetical protein
MDTTEKDKRNVLFLLEINKKIIITYIYFYYY